LKGAEDVQYELIRGDIPGVGYKKNGRKDVKPGYEWRIHLGIFYCKGVRAHQFFLEQQEGSQSDEEITNSIPL